MYKDRPEYSNEFELSLKPEEPGFWKGSGSGYVVDSLRSAVMIMQTAETYEEAVKRSVALGDDTDTTACITGGLAGIKFGYNGIPERWKAFLRDSIKAEDLAKKLVSFRCA